jgi:hypothetical protein
MRERRQSARRWRAITALAVLVSSSACGHPGTTDASTATVETASTTPNSPTAAPEAAMPHGGLPNPHKVDGNNPDAVSRAALTVMWTIDTAIDQGGQHDAYLRAIPYLTDAYATQIRAQPPQTGSAQTILAGHHAYTQVKLTQGHDDGAPPDTTTVAYRQWVITVTAIGRDGWKGPPVTNLAYLVLNRSGPRQPWRISLANIS